MSKKEKETKNLSQSKNRVQIVGTIEEINLVYDEKRKNKNNPDIVGAIAKADTKSPAITIKANGEIYEVEIIPTYSQIEDKETKELKDNPRFKALETVMGYEKGTRVIVNGSFAENGYVNKQGEWSSRTQIQSFSISSSNVPAEDSTDGKISGIVKNIKEETVNDEETGRLLVELYSVNYDGSVFPINLVVSEELASDFEDLYSKGDSVMLDVELKTKTVGAKKSDSKRAFGKRESKVVEGYTTVEISVFGGEEAIDDDESQYYIDIDKFKKAMSDREVMINAKKEEARNGGSDNTTSKKGLGLGNRPSKVTEEDDVEDDPFA